MEFSCGCATDIHESPKVLPQWPKDKQPFILKGGGFLSVKVFKIDNNPTITFRHHDEYGEVLYKWQKSTSKD